MIVFFTQQGAGNAIMIVVGGAAEALDARPGVTELVLAERKGFVKSMASILGPCMISSDIMAEYLSCAQLL